MQIRQATPEDVEQLTAMHARLEEHFKAANPDFWPPTPADVAGWTDNYRRWIAEDDAVFLVAQDRVELAGFAVGEVLEREGGTPTVVGSIRLAYVREDRRNQGIGTALVDRLLAFFESRGVQEVTTAYVVGNAEGERFWTGFGFRGVILTVNASARALRERVRDRQGDR
jgi:GNAT superfamily N-acetyltransferase